MAQNDWWYFDSFPTRTELLELFDCDTTDYVWRGPGWYFVKVNDRELSLTDAATRSENLKKVFEYMFKSLKESQEKELGNQCLTYVS